MSKKQQKVTEAAEVTNPEAEQIEQVIPEKLEPTQEEKYAELNDRFLRLYAEFENFRRRTNKEHLELISSANSNLLKDLVPVLDDFEYAAKATTLPLMLLGGDPGKDWQQTFNKWEQAFKYKNVRALIPGRSLLFSPDLEVEDAVAKAVSIVRKL